MSIMATYETYDARQILSGILMFNLCMTMAIAYDLYRVQKYVRIDKDGNFEEVAEEQ